MTSLNSDIVNSFETLTCSTVLNRYTHDIYEKKKKWKILTIEETSQNVLKMLVDLRHSRIHISLELLSYSASRERFKTDHVRKRDLKIHTRVAIYLCWRYVKRYSYTHGSIKRNIRRTTEKRTNSRTDPCRGVSRFSVNNDMTSIVICKWKKIVWKTTIRGHLMNVYLDPKSVRQLNA